MKLAANAFIVSLTTAAVLAGSNLARASDAGAVVAQAAGADLAGLQVLSPTGRAGDRLRWAAWQAPAVDGAVGRGVRFALFRRTAGAARREWTIVRPEAYMPAIQIVSSWSYLGRPIALLTYQMGAADQELEVYGLDRDDQPRRLGQLAAAVFDFRPVGGFTIEAVDAPDPPRCWGYAPALAALTHVACPP